MMKKVKKGIALLALSSIMIGTLSGCTKNDASSSDEITVSFWSSPQKVQYDFWEGKAKEFNSKELRINDKVVKVEVQQMPETPSSEAGIQNALATDTVPAISENVNRGFAATLADSDAIYNLDEEEWFKDVVKNKDIEDVIEGWQIEGKQYVIPQYVNPMVLQWNSKGLKALGYDNPPTTKAEFEELITTFRANKDKMKEVGVSSVMYRNQLIRPDFWWDRWNDFQNIYLSFSGGKPWVEGNKLVLDKEVTKEVFEFFGTMGDTLLTQEIPNLWAEEKPQALCSIAAPWEINALREGGKIYGEDYVFGPMIVKNEGDTAYNFADSKGLVLYKDANITDEIHQGAVEFVKWLYSEENSSKTDLEWVQATTMLPVRGDLVENDTFKTYLDENVELKVLAQEVPNAVPCMPHGKMAEIQEALGGPLAEYIEITLGSTSLKPTDATKYVDKAFDAMKQAGGLE